MTTVIRFPSSRLTEKSEENYKPRKREASGKAVAYLAVMS